MKRYVKQFRYYGEGSSLNSVDINATALANGGAFNNYTPIVKLGIQTIPGTRFYINGSVESTIVNNSGIFELDLEDRIQITGLRFNPMSLVKISQMEKGYLLVDIVYESTEE
jgi:hypothetical protein